MPDIRYIASIHDHLGPITTFCAETRDGREWLKKWCGNIIETEQAAMVVRAMRDDGLKVTKAG